MAVTDLTADVTPGPAAAAPNVALRLRADRPVVGFALAAIVLLAAATATAIDFRQGVLVLIGSGLGLALYHASFGFTGGWRAFVTEGRGAGLRAQLLMIGLTTLLLLPFIVRGEAFGQPIDGALGPLGTSLAVGAFIFGFGMQLGGGCGSGTLFTVGGGNVRMLVTLLFFIVGALIGTLHLPWWQELPEIGVIRLPELIGLWPTIAVQWLALAAIAAVTIAIERRRRGGATSILATPQSALSWHRRLRLGPWPLVWGAVALAVLNLATLLVSGHPWSITFAFNIWGAKAASVVGIDVAGWEYWTWPMPAQALNSSILADTTSVMDFGLILGALLAAGLAARFAPDARIPLRSLLAAILGGLLMGYGARLAFGCNIGALVGGIASGSLHGWAWFAIAFAGSLVGIRARPLFGLRG